MNLKNKRIRSRWFRNYCKLMDK